MIENSKKMSWKVSNAKSLPIQIKDMRFEQSFLDSLQKYANQSAERSSKKKKKLSSVRSKDPSEYPDDLLDEEIEENGLAPLEPITPSIIIFAIIKDVILIPFIGSFVWKSVLLLAKPTLRLITELGYRCGLWLSGQLGLRRLPLRTDLN